MKDLRKLFGTDGIRGIANRDLTAELALKVGRAGAKFLVPKNSRGKIIIGKDPRPSGDLLEASLISGILSEGTDVLRAGIISTPAIALMVKILDLDGGAVISASHNPVEDNGIKFFGRNGKKLSDSQERSIEDYILSKKDYGELPSGVQVGRVTELKQANEIYLNYILKYFDIDLSNFKIVIDCANGATSILAKEALTRLGAEVLDYYTDISGENINRGCGSTHPEVLKELVLRNRADIGFAYDGDGDRVIACDSDGEILNGDNIIAFCAIEMQKKGELENNSIVTTVMANMGFNKAMEQKGIKVYQTKVGDRYVLEKMLEVNSILGGEQSGHIILSNISPTGDGLLSSLCLLQSAIRSNTKINQIRQTFQNYPQLLKNVKVKDKAGIFSGEKLQIKLIEMEKYLGDSGRIVLRPSGTEALVRVMAEARSMEMAARAVNELVEVIKKMDC